MRQAGFVDPNTKIPRASMRRLAEKANVHTSTVAAVMFGDRAPKHATITAVAEALGVDVRTVAEQAGQTRTEREPYAMPDEVHLLSGRVQVAITQLIRAIAEERGHGGLNTAAIVTDVTAEPLTSPELKRAAGLRRPSARRRQG